MLSVSDRNWPLVIFCYQGLEGYFSDPGFDQNSRKRKIPWLHTYLHPSVNSYALGAFTTFAQIYPSVCTNLDQKKFGANQLFRPLYCWIHLAGTWIQHLFYRNKSIEDNQNWQKLNKMIKVIYSSPTVLWYIKSDKFHFKSEDKKEYPNEKGVG